MNEIEKHLAEEKKKMEQITAPAELEGRLWQALDAATVKKKLKPKWPLAVAAFLLVCLIGYNYNGLAYYGKKIIGFDELMSGTLTELNDKGMGQTVGKKVLLEDGTELTVDGIMTDANQLILYYTLSNVKEMEGITFGKITGFLTDSNQGAGTLTFNEKQSEIKGQLFFDPVSPFAKKLTLEATKLAEDGQTITGIISFPYDPNQAMQTELQQKLMKTVKVDKGTITFKTITATPTVTIIKGTVDVQNIDRVQLPFKQVQLLVNGKPVEQIGSGISTSIGGTKFELSFESLPQKVDSLGLVVKEFVGYTNVDETIPLHPIQDQAFQLEGKDLWVKEVEKTEDGVQITIASDEDVLLDGVTIDGKGGEVPLKTTIRQDYKELDDGRVVKERTLLFSTDIVPDTLSIKGMHHRKSVDEVVEILVE
ncbi:DUF4179 domain-containing protein [Sporosarcina sp. Te-1]|uniref:DUF4179 domain-containing protein n=1 Tax=Sporosarcina sp. Te-1 TaxID=2818390 RepID=UPI001A9D7863|nr:DUF4179 domain-containing protein [Sporosarcina sp. Te-1]QTD39484.1 DUF4179 domain-containing protein [Sporosarcina sp. Te-1]